MINQDDIIYFIMTDRFCKGDPTNDNKTDPDKPKKFHGGDFAGLIKKLPYFKTLGITAIWITPVYLNITDNGDSAGYHGYWAIDFDRIDPHLYSAVPGRSSGSRMYLQELVQAFNDEGLKVVLDMVVNHTGYHTPEYNDYPLKKFADWDFNKNDDRDEQKKWLCGLPDLNCGSPYVADYFIQNILDWIEQTGIDGIRMDTVKHVEDRFWYLFKAHIKARHPGITLIGEVLDYNPAYIGRYQQENDFDSIFDFPLSGAVRGALIWDQPMTVLARPRIADSEQQGALDVSKPYSNENRLVTLLDNHDLDRRVMSEIYDCVGEWDKNLAKTILKLCFSFLLTTRGIPQIYYGTEIGMRGRKDDNDSNRIDMPWDIFGPDHLPKPDHPWEWEIFEHVRNLIALRRDNPAFRYGYLITLYVDQFIYCCLREFRGNVVLIAINNGRQDMPFPLPIEIAANGNLPPRIKQLLPDGKVLTSKISGLEALTLKNGKVAVQLPSKAAGIYVL